MPLGTAVTITSDQTFREEITMLRTISPISGQFLKNCLNALTCSTTQTFFVPVTHEYYGRNDHQASNRVRVTWVDVTNPTNVPSATCTSSITDATVLGTNVKLSNTVTASEISLCARVNSAVVRTGGKLTITSYEGSG